jgi:hypothetical protein
MSDSGHHCPFLNRADARCARHFSIDDLGYAFQHCFGQYEACGAYRELLGERRVRRARGLDTIGEDDGAGHGSTYGSSGDNVIQVTIAGRIGHGAADPAVVSHASGV